MEAVDRNSFSKRRYIDSMTLAQAELGSILPYGEWGDTFSEPFRRMRESMSKYFGGPEKYLAVPESAILPERFADQFNQTIVPLTQGMVRNRDVILPWHGPPEVVDGNTNKDKKPKTSRSTHSVPYPRL